MRHARSSSRSSGTGRDGRKSTRPRCRGGRAHGTAGDDRERVVKPPRRLSTCAPRRRRRRAIVGASARPAAGAVERGGRRRRLRHRRSACRDFRRLMVTSRSSDRALSSPSIRRARRWRSPARLSNAGGSRDNAPGRSKRLAARERWNVTPRPRRRAGRTRDPGAGGVAASPWRAFRGRRNFGGAGRRAGVGWTATCRRSRTRPPRLSRSRVPFDAKPLRRTRWPGGGRVAGSG